MVPASLSKTSGLRLLSSLRPLLPICPSTSSYCTPLNQNRHQKRNTSTPLLSISKSPLHKHKETAPLKVSTFCTASNIVADPSSPTTTSSDEGIVDMVKVKDMANTLDIRVGKILKAWRHEEADSLYVEEVDIGETEPRIICSGLVKYVPLDDLQDKSVVVLANLKPRNMRGVKSCGMLMAASDAAHQNVELLEPPEGSVPGERVWFGTEDDKERIPEAVSPNQIQKKKIWEQVQPHLSTDGSCVAWLGGTHLMLAPAGSVRPSARTSVSTEIQRKLTSSG